jgi:hypothetical protein
MADLIIKPNSATGDKLILQDRAGGAVLTTADSGATIANSTLVAPALGTVASGNLSNANVIGTGGLKSMQVFTSSGTWTKPSGITSIKVYITGGGGGGGGATSNDKGAGGGAGGTAIEIIDVTSVSSVTVTIGAGGAGASGSVDGSTGVTSSFGSHCSATGGVGGKFGNAGPSYGGSGGVATGGNLNLHGGMGNSGQDNNFDSAYESSFGIGGASFWGGGGRPSSDTNAAPAALVYGSGAGGGCEDAPQAGAGAAGVCVVEEYR